MSLAMPTHHISFSKTLSSSNPLFLSGLTRHSHSPTNDIHCKTMIVRMGPRTYPGGVSKWQWKRMQARKAKQLFKAGLSRERQIYEMRKRAELKAAVSELERPWEAARKAPELFSVGTDEQVKVPADRFERPSGFDLSSKRDGPRSPETPKGVPSARIFSKGVVHSIKPNGSISGFGESDDEDGISDLETEIEIESVDGSKRKNMPVNGKLRGGFHRKGKRDNFDSQNACSGSSAGESNIDTRSRNMNKFKLTKNGGGRIDSGSFGFDARQTGGNRSRRPDDSNRRKA